MRFVLSSVNTLIPSFEKTAPLSPEKVPLPKPLLPHLLRKTPAESKSWSREFPESIKSTSSFGEITSFSPQSIPVPFPYFPHVVTNSPSGENF
ncbi:MAG: hypothetical protein BWY82_01320 [Verrucomicrobia bacterium ADurb.Bin474]|nr:MAG: hypothetical protein BWY82_01320 [Verrucomicrobia bacterium ADurb.Bin474]